MTRRLWVGGGSDGAIKRSKERERVIYRLSFVICRWPKCRSKLIALDDRLTVREQGG